MELFKRSSIILNELNNISLNELVDEFISYCEVIDIEGLQKNWTNKDRDRVGPIELIDNIGRFSDRFKKILKKKNLTERVLLAFIEDELKNGNGRVDNKKLSDNPIDVFVGMLIGSCFNSIMSGKRKQLELSLVTA